jgi:protein required for attachment to host cells
MTAQTSISETPCWAVVVADESSAIIYGRESLSGPMRELFSLDNATARMKTDQLISDSGGRSFDSHGKGRHTMGHEKADPKKTAAMAFAKQIAERIVKGTYDGSFRGFALVAAPRFLGVLRDALSVATTVEPYTTVDKEVVGKDVAVIEKLLAT